MLDFDFLEKCLGLVSPPHFVYLFFRENELTDQIWLSDCLYFLKYVSYNYFFPVYDIISFEKFKTKIKISLERKKLLRWNKKQFSSIFKGFQFPDIVSDLRVHLYLYPPLKSSENLRFFWWF